MEVAQYVDKIDEIIDRGGPRDSEYGFLKKVPQEMTELSLEGQQKVYERLAPILTVNSMIGFTFNKPHGYAGDYELINRIYREWHSEDESLYKWDLFYHELEAASAVRNRKNYFKNLVNKTEEIFKKPHVLNLGSGPCNDLYEYFQNKPKNTTRFDCLDMDANAIEYGQGLCDNYYQSINFIHKNAFRFKPDYKYELIWSAGLFDYFSDKLFIRLLNRMYALVKSGGEVVIGNFSTYNPSRDVMEVFGQWYLHHRNKEKLTELAIKAGVPEDLIEVLQEETGVNLFLHLKKN